MDGPAVRFAAVWLIIGIVIDVIDVEIGVIYYYCLVYAIVFDGRQPLRGLSALPCCPLLFH